ncbi:MKKS protein, partial [Atractosteus spatula]|nr:MKKS protein [Atractosteus spatula]
MSRLSNKKTSLCTSEPLSDDKVCQKLAVFRQIFTSCFGPTGRLKQIHNNVGGHVQTTSTSAVLLKGVFTSHPVLKLLTASVLNHISCFGDCGLFAAILSCALIENAQRLNIETGITLKVYRHLLCLCNDYLNQEECGCRVRIDFGNSQSLLSLARSVIASKPACMLTYKEVQHVSSLVVQAFLQTVPCEAEEYVCLGKVVFVSVEGHRAMDSALFPGLLVEMPEMLSPSDLKRLDQRAVTLALFNTSLSGDLSETGDGTLEVSCGLSPEAAVLELLLRMGKQIVSDSVALLACQKVVHPVLKQYLKEHHVIVIERLGISLMEPLSQMTGALPIASFQSPVPSKCYGQLSNILVKSFGSRQMLNLIPAGDSTVCSLGLCNRNETTLNELKLTCQNAEHVLRLSLKSPFVLFGGGCTETHLAAYIRNKCSSGVDGTLLGLGCSPTQFQMAADSFCRALESVGRSLEHDGGESLVDLCCGHRWSGPGGAAPDVPWKDVVSLCGCGRLDRQEGLQWVILGGKGPSFSPTLPAESCAQHLVLDSFPAKLNALQVAVETANLILDLKYVIQDVN